jgi:light-harvesting complex 1 beta chain
MSGTQSSGESFASKVLAARDLRGNGRKANQEVNLMADANSGSLSGLTASEAREFHAIFMTSFIIFTVIAVIAHILVWNWRPWLPGSEGYASLIEGVKAATYSVIPYIYQA